jgi:hypothetical protein
LPSYFFLRAAPLVDTRPIEPYFWVATIFSQRIGEMAFFPRKSRIHVAAGVVGVVIIIGGQSRV